jgi:hypothetical protein
MWRAAFSSKSVLMHSRLLFADSDPGGTDKGRPAMPIAFLEAPLQPIGSDFEVTNVTRLPGIETLLKRGRFTW